MANEKKSKKGILALTPKSLDVIIDGQEVRVALDKFENALLNAVVAGQLRGLLQEQIKKYRDNEAVLTPRELKDLAETGKSISAMSHEICVTTDAQQDKPGEKAADKSDDIDFGDLTVVATRKAPQADGGEPKPDVQGEDPKPA